MKNTYMYYKISRDVMQETLLLEFFDFWTHIMRGNSGQSIFRIGHHTCCL